MTWPGALKASWDSHWNAFAAEAERRYSADIVANWDKYRARVTAVVDAIMEAHRSIEALGPAIDRYEAAGGTHGAEYRTNLAAMTSRWNTLAAGVLDGAQKRAPDGTSVPAMGASPYVVGVVALALMGVAFAIAAYEYAMSLRDTAGMQLAEVNARREAMEKGKVLQPSTAPPPAPPPGPPDSTQSALLVLTGVAAAGLLGWLVLRN